MTAALSPSKDRNGSICARMLSTQEATVSLVLSVRSEVGRRVADQPGRPADERQRPVTGLLQAPRGEHLDEVTVVQARRRRVEAARSR